MIADQFFYFDQDETFLTRIHRADDPKLGKSAYMLSASLRNDGSSNFGASHRYATFPGVSVGWNINEEKFMSSFSSIDNLKLRVSYGEVGNEGIPQYLYSAYIDPNIDYVWGPESSDQLVAGAIQRGYANPDVKWETNISRNIGLDLLMFSGKFSLSADVYQNDKKDMLLRVLLPSSTGTYISNNVIYDWENRYNSTMINAGNMINKGIELASSYKSRTNFGLGWQISGTFTKNINRITSYNVCYTKLLREYYMGGKLDRVGYDNNGDGKVDAWDRAPSTSTGGADVKPPEESSSSEPE